MKRKRKEQTIREIKTAAMASVGGLGGLLAALVLMNVAILIFTERSPSWDFLAMTAMMAPFDLIAMFLVIFSAQAMWRKWRKA